MSNAQDFTYTKKPTGWVRFGNSCVNLNNVTDFRRMQLPNSECVTIELIGGRTIDVHITFERMISLIEGKGVDND